MMFGWSILMHNGYDLDFRIDQGWDEVSKEVFSWEPKGNEGALLREKAREYDINDLLVRNESQSDLDLDQDLHRIALPTLVLHVENDLWLRARKARESADAIPGAEFASFESPLAHYAVFRAPNVLKEEVRSFFKKIGMAEGPPP